MLWESSLLLVIVKLSIAEENCTDTCIECSDGVCLKCEDGYYGKECETCISHCKGWWDQCREIICPFGCMDGWYGLICDVRCDDACVTGRCERFHGGCYDESGCEYGVCRYGCRHYCPKEEEKTKVYTEYNPEEEDSGFYLPSEIIIVLVVGFLIFVVCSCCCVVAYAKKPATNASVPVPDPSSIPRMDIIPSSQRLLPGQQPYTFCSSNTTYTDSLRDAYLDSNNILRYPGSAADNVRESGTPPPAYEDNSQSPPPYDALFKQTSSPSDGCVSSQGLA